MEPSDLAVENQGIDLVLPGVVSMMKAFALRLRSRLLILKELQLVRVYPCQET